MQETEPLHQDTSYQQDDDIQIDDHKQNEANWKKDFNQPNVQDLINEEMTEPELMFLCQDEPEAINLIKKCSKWTTHHNWPTMKNYLNDIIDMDTQSDKLNCMLFVKLFYLGVCDFRLEDYSSALNHFIEAHKTHQQYQLNYNIALCYIKLNNLETAVFYLEAVTKKNKNFFFAYYNLIKIYLRKNNINDAFLIYRDFSDIIKKEKEKEKLSEQTGLNANGRLSVTSFNTLKLFYKIGAECLFAKQLYQECVYTLLEALKFNPEDPELWFLYAKVFVMKKSFEYAIPLLKKAVELDPGFIEPKKLLQFLEKNAD